MAPSIARRILLQHAAALYEARSNVDESRAAAIRLLRDLAEDSERYRQPFQPSPAQMAQLAQLESTAA